MSHDSIQVLPTDSTQPDGWYGDDHRDDHGTFSYYHGVDGPVTGIDTLRQTRFRVYTVTAADITAATRRE